MPPASPEAREAEARRDVMQAVVDGFRDAGVRATLESLESTALDAYRTAVRAARDAELRAGIETLERWGVAHIEGEDVLGHVADGDYLDRFDVLTLLTPET